MKVENEVLALALRALSMRIADHCMRVFVESGTLLKIVGSDVEALDEHTARMSARLSDGAVICADYDLWDAAIAQVGGLAAIHCYGWAARAN